MLPKTRGGAWELEVSVIRRQLLHERNSVMCYWAARLYIIGIFLRLKCRQCSVLFCECVCSCWLHCTMRYHFSGPFRGCSQFYENALANSLILRFNNVHQRLISAGALPHSPNPLSQLGSEIPDVLSHGEIFLWVKSALFLTQDNK